jgi:hypothetical protein
LQDYLPPFAAASEVRVSLSSVIEFAVVRVTGIPLSVVFVGVITIWTIIALLMFTEV